MDYPFKETKKIEHLIWQIPNKSFYSFLKVCWQVLLFVFSMALRQNRTGSYLLLCVPKPGSDELPTGQIRCKNILITVARRWRSNSILD